MQNELESKRLDLTRLSGGELDKELGVWLHYHCSHGLRFFEKRIVIIDSEPAIVYYSNGAEIIRLTGKQLAMTGTEALTMLDEFARGWKSERPTQDVRPRLYRVTVCDDQDAEHCGSGSTFLIAAAVAILRATGIEVVEPRWK